MFKYIMCRRNFLSKILAGRYRRLIKQYENLNYEFDSNGERLLLRKLSTLDIKTVFDVGGNVGDYSVMLREYFPDTSLHIFEIMQDNIELIEEKFKGHKGVFINNFGLSDEGGVVKVKYYGEGSGLSSIYDYPHDSNSSWVECQVQKGGSYVKEKNIDTIDFLKIDTEGSEHKVLEGFYDIFKTKNIRIVQFEYGYVNIITKFLLRDFYSFFTDLGYVVGKVYPKRVEFNEYKLSDENFLGPNYIAVKKSEAEVIKLLAK